MATVTRIADRQTHANSETPRRLRYLWPDLPLLVPGFAADRRGVLLVVGSRDSRQLVLSSSLVDPNVRSTLSMECLRDEQTREISRLADIGT